MFYPGFPFFFLKRPCLEAIFDSVDLGCIVGRDAPSPVLKRQEFFRDQLINHILQTVGIQCNLYSLADSVVDLAGATEIARARTVCMQAPLGDRHGSAAGFANKLSSQPTGSVAEGLANLLVLGKCNALQQFLGPFYKVQRNIDNGFILTSGRV